MDPSRKQRCESQSYLLSLLDNTSLVSISVNKHIGSIAFIIKLIADIFSDSDIMIIDETHVKSRISDLSHMTLILHQIIEHSVEHNRYSL